MTERHIYLIRHGTPAFPHDKRHFYSRTDYDLSELGKEDARLMAIRLKDMLTLPFHFYTSPLLRSRRTAEALPAIWPEAGAPTPVPDLMELSMGDWEGMLFSDVERMAPDAFALRGIDPALHTPPGGESHEACQERVYRAIEAIVRSTTHDVVIVAHAMVNLIFLAKVLDWPLTGLRARAQPYGSYNVLRLTESGYEPVILGRMPTDAPSEAKIRHLQHAYRMYASVRQHTAAVRELAVSYAEAVNRKRRDTGAPLIDIPLLAAAADLHDIARGEPQHAKAGAAILRYEGYPEVARIIGDHQDLPEEKIEALDESSLLYLADKNVLEDDVVGIESRFNDSYCLCDSDKSRAKHARRKEAALRVEASLRAVLS
jgi:broad specificity phosphatase PhoE